MQSAARDTIGDESAILAIVNDRAGFWIAPEGEAQFEPVSDQRLL